MRLMLLFTLALIFAATQALPLLAQCTVKECCPLPKEFYFKVGDKEDKENKAFDHGGLDGTNFSEALEGTTVDDKPAEEPLVEFNENEGKKYELKMTGGLGIDLWAPGSEDCSTKAKLEQDNKWEPNHKLHDPPEDTATPQHRWGAEFGGAACWRFDKATAEWKGGTQQWQISQAAHAYHFDSPTLWGQNGGIGDNTSSPGKDEGYSGDKGQQPNEGQDWTYYVPSVPYNYYISSAMTAKWKWNAQQNYHKYIHTPTGCPNMANKCTSCPDMCTKLVHTSTFVPTKVIGVEFTPDQFYSGEAIDDASLATARQGERTFDEDGIKGKIYDEETQARSFGLPGIPADVARVAVRIHDIKRITNISHGTGNDCLWKSSTGEKITDTDNHQLQFQLFDNAPHMTLEACQKAKEAGQYFSFDNFHARFWYEDLVYDYAGFNNPALQLDEVFYAPKFVWKIGAEWKGASGFEEFARFGTTEPMKDGSEATTNPNYVKWELNFNTDDLFSGRHNGEEEDIMPLHYAETALGDQFGNPRWEQGEYDGEDFASYSGVVDKFKNKPLHFSKGRGMLKTFFQVNQCSIRIPDENGAGDVKFDTAKDYWFKNLEKGASTYQEQVKFNPENVEYIQSPGSDTVSGGDTVDPSSGGSNLPVTEYKDMGDHWLQGAQMKNGKDADKFQAWGKVTIEDNDRPGVGLRIFNKSSNKVRLIYRKNSIDKLGFYNSVKGGGQQETLRNDKSGGDTQYKDDDEEWLFDKKPTDLGQGSDDSEMGYGCFEDVDLELSHNDLKNSDKDGSVLCFYAHDNVDGQRIKYSAEVEKGYFYKGVECDGSMREQYPSSADGDSYAKNFINNGYKSWLVFDNTYSEPKMLENYRPDGNNFVYPNITFHNPNKKGDGSELNPGASDIHVSYQVRDRAGNTRKFRLNFFVKAIDVNLNTLERHDRRWTEDKD